MPELLAIALVCSLALSPDECSRDTALDVLIAPARSTMECIQGAQSAAGNAGLPGEGRYVKIVCERRTKLAGTH